MENEIMNNEMIEEIEVIDGVEEAIDESIDKMSGKTIAGLVAGAVLVIGGVLIYKNRQKFTEWRIRRLEKKGYVVIRPEMVEECDIEETDDDCCEEQ